MVQDQRIERRLPQMGKRLPQMIKEKTNLFSSAASPFDLSHLR
jgi:hypothetical protein